MIDNLRSSSPASHLQNEITKIVQTLQMAFFELQFIRYGEIEL